MPSKPKAQPSPALAPATPTPPPPTGKLGVITALLQRPDGATIPQMIEATGWQSHSVRGALAGALKKRGLVVISTKVDGVRTYRLAPGDEASS